LRIVLNSVGLDGQRWNISNEGKEWAVRVERETDLLWKDGRAKIDWRWTSICVFALIRRGRLRKETTAVHCTRTPETKVLI
jgi:hypothetical protein